MDLSNFFYILHTIGVALGIGGATTSDFLFFRSLRDKKISADEFALLNTASKVVIIGLAIIVFSGSGILVSQYLSSGSLPANDQFYAKMTVVFVILLNGAVFHKLIFPRLFANIDKPLDKSADFAGSIWIFAFAGSVSVVSWYSALLLGAARGIAFPYLFLMTFYVFLIFLATIISYLILRHKIFSSRPDAGSERTSQEDNSGPHRKETEKNSRLWFALLVALVFIQAGVIFSVVAGGSIRQVFSAAKTYEVCIRESAPWFFPEVIEIKKGDTIVWVHCEEEEDDSRAHLDHAWSWTEASMSIIKSAFPIEFIGARNASADNNHDEGKAQHLVHPHPIMALSGPELFSSNFAPVGHKENWGEFSFTFTKEGVYEYICPTHPYMKGVIAVGVKPQKTSLWPPEEIIKPSLLPPPSEPGVGEIWVDTQFEKVAGQNFPGTITVIDAGTWQVKKVIAHESFNNPHNLWHSYDGRYVYQTQWHSDELSKIDAKTKEVIGTVRLGNAPAHVFVHPEKDRVYVTLNNEDRVIILNRDLNILGEIKTSFGPHGVWIDPSAKWMSIAATLDEKLNIIDLDTEKVVATFDAPGLPLASAITRDGRYAMISMLLEGKVRFIDLTTMKYVKDVEVGKAPIWPAPGPNGKYVFVLNSGTADISVISLETLEVVKTLPAAGGAHGIIFGQKQSGGYYGYFSNKFARVVGVIDADTLETVGYIRLSETAWGGNGILTLPNAYDEFISK